MLLFHDGPAKKTQYLACSEGSSAMRADRMENTDKMSPTENIFFLAARITSLG
jgi:hypothetical protein